MAGLPRVATIVLLDHMHQSLSPCQVGFVRLGANCAWQHTPTPRVRGREAHNRLHAL